MPVFVVERDPRTGAPKAGSVVKGVVDSVSKAVLSKTAAARRSKRGGATVRERPYTIEPAEEDQPHISRGHSQQTKQNPAGAACITDNATSTRVIATLHLNTQLNSNPTTNASTQHPHTTQPRSAHGHSPPWV